MTRIFSLVGEGAGEVAQQARALAALGQNLDSVLSSPKSAVTPGPGDPVHFLPPWVPGTHPYTRAKHPSHQIELKTSK